MRSRRGLGRGSVQLVTLKTERDKDRAYMLEALDEMRAEVEAGKVASLGIVWEDANGEAKSSFASPSSWKLVAILEMAKLRLLTE